MNNDITQWPKVSVIVLNAFSTDNLKECLDSLIKTDYEDFETIVVDCLTQGIENFIRSFLTVKLIALQSDIGPSEMHNVAIKNADPLSKYIAFLDNDTVVEKNWLKNIICCIEKDKNVGAVQAKIRLYQKKSLLNTMGNKANYLAIGWSAGYGIVDKESDGCAREISYPSGCGMVLRRDALEKIGMFDGDLFIEGDDLDVGLRLRVAGYSSLYCPQSIVFHKYKFLKKKRNFYYLNRNRIHTFLKLYKKKTYVSLIPAVLLYEFSVFVFALSNSFHKEIIAAYAYNIKSIAALSKKRKHLMKYKVISDGQLIRQLDGAIDFYKLSNNPFVKLILNPFLELYKRILLKTVK